MDGQGKGLRPVKERNAMKLSKEELLAGARSVAMEFRRPYAGVLRPNGAPTGDLVITAPSDAGGWNAKWMYTNDKGERKVGSTLTMTDSDVVLRALILAAFDE